MLNALVLGSEEIVKPYNVFLSYNSQDKTPVEWLARTSSEEVPT